jgi:O-methyltransferase involved in polyketide biosynthesis
VSQRGAEVTPTEPDQPKQGNLSVTALYTAETWGWGGLPGAELLVSDQGRNVFKVTNFALAITRIFKPGVRSLRHSLLHRHTMIDHLAAASGARQILELAAGLSRRGVARSADSELRYTEVDLPPIVAHKRMLLERSEAGREALARPNLRLVSGDVLEVDLADLVDRTAPLFVIAEGLFMYLKPEQQRALWRKVRGLAGDTQGGTFVFDLVPACEEPRPGAIGHALGWLMKRFTGGKTFERDPRTRDDLAAELREAGFDEVETVEPAAVAHAWGLPFPEVPTQQLLFVARVRATAERSD